MNLIIEKFGLCLMPMKTVICWSFIVLNNFYCKHVCEKKLCLTTRHRWLQVESETAAFCATVPLRLRQIIY